MKYFQCNNCVFFVTKEDTMCANCGILSPEKPFRTLGDKISRHYIIALIVSFVVVVIAGLIVENITTTEFGFYTMVGLTLIALLSHTILKNIEQKQKAKRTTGRGFRDTKAHIEKRYSEIALRGKQIKEVLIKARKHKSKEWGEVCTMLEGALVTLTDQHLRYQAKSLEIDIVRQQNRLSPITEKLNTATYEEIDQNLESIEKVAVDCSAINNEFRKIYSDLDNNAISQTVKNRITETLKSCEKLHQAFIGRQAVLALQNVNPLTEALESPLSINGAFNESDVFNSQMAITDFTESFDELEAEYIRLNAEEDLAKQVSNIINKANNI